MKVKMTSIDTLQLIIRNVREAVEKELGPIITVDATGIERMHNLSYATYVELLRGEMSNLPKNINIPDDGMPRSSSDPWK